MELSGCSIIGPSRPLLGIKQPEVMILTLSNDLGTPPALPKATYTFEPRSPSSSPLIALLLSPGTRPEVCAAVVQAMTVPVIYLNTGGQVLPGLWILQAEDHAVHVDAPSARPAGSPNCIERGASIGRRGVPPPTLQTLILSVYLGNLLARKLDEHPGTPTSLCSDDTTPGLSLPCSP